MSYAALEASDGAGESIRATVQSPGRSIGSSVIPVNAITNWPTGQCIVTTGTLQANNTISNPQVFYGTASGTSITISSFAPGYTDLGNVAGDVVVIKPTTEWANLVAKFVMNATGLGTPDNLTANGLTAASLILNGSLTGSGLASQIQSYTNSGSAGGTGYYINIAGIKLCWGTTSQNSSFNSASYSIAMPLAFFTTTQTVILTSGNLVTDKNQGVTLSGSATFSTSSLTYYSWSESNSPSAGQSVSWLVIGT